MSSSATCAARTPARYETKRGASKPPRAARCSSTRSASYRPSLQAKLLRFLQDRQFERLGENQTRSADVRIVAATNRDLDAEVKAGRFREDLLFRLNTLEIVVPPLRERREDIVPLARRFLAWFARERAAPGMGSRGEDADQRPPALRLARQHPQGSPPARSSARWCSPAGTQHRASSPLLSASSGSAAVPHLGGPTSRSTPSSAGTSSAFSLAPRRPKKPPASSASTPADHGANARRSTRRCVSASTRPPRTPRRAGARRARSGLRRHRYQSPLRSPRLLRRPERDRRLARQRPRRICRSCSGRSSRSYR